MILRLNCCDADVFGKQALDKVYGHMGLTDGLRKFIIKIHFWHPTTNGRKPLECETLGWSTWVEKYSARSLGHIYTIED